MTYYQIDGMIGNELGAVAPQSSAMGPAPAHAAILNPNVAVATSLALNEFQNEINSYYTRFNDVTTRWDNIRKLASEKYSVRLLPLVQLTAIAVTSIGNRIHLLRDHPDWATNLDQQNKALITGVFNLARGHAGPLSIVSLLW